MQNKFDYYYVQTVVFARIKSQPKDMPASLELLSRRDGSSSAENKKLVSKFDYLKEGLAGDGTKPLDESSDSDADVDPKIFSFLDEVNPNPTPNPPSPTIGKYASVYYYLGIRLDTLLYSNEGLRNILGFYDIGYITRAERVITTKIIRNSSDALALNVVDCNYAIFRAKDPSVTHPSWGERQKTYLFFDKTKDASEVKQQLLEYELKVDPSQAVYLLEGDSFKPRRLRKGVPQV